MRSLFEIACERCNSNDGKSACEAVVGELRAKLLRLVAISPQVADSPPARGGNCVIRTTTRRRHTASQFLMLQNPHRHRCGGCRRGRRAWLRCPWRWRGLVGLFTATGPTGVKGAGGVGGPGCGARGRWRGLAGLRGDAPSEARGADDSRAGRRPRAHKAARPTHRAARPHIQQRARSAAAPRAPRVSVAHRLSWMLRPGTASISSRV